MNVFTFGRRGTSIQFPFTAETNVMLLNCRSDAGVRGLQLIVQSSVKVNTSYLLYVKPTKKYYENPFTSVSETNVQP